MFPFALGTQSVNDCAKLDLVSALPSLVILGGAARIADQQNTPTACSSGQSVLLAARIVGVRSPQPTRLFAEVPCRKLVTVALIVCTFVALEIHRVWKSAGPRC